MSPPSVEGLGLYSFSCILSNAMRRIGLHGLSSALALVAVLLISVGCTGDSLESSKQLALSNPTQQEEQDTSSHTSKVTNALGSYYDNTVTFLTDDCGVGAYSVATGKAVVYGIGGGLWGASKATMYGAIHYSDSLEGVVIGAAVGSGLGLVVGVKNAYDGFKADTVGWSS